MNRNQCIREILIETDNLTTKEVFNKLIEKYPQIWTKKVSSYADVGKEKSEDWVTKQLIAEVGSQLINWRKQGRVISTNTGGNTLYRISELYKKELSEELFIEDENTYLIEDEEVNDECDDCENQGGFVYFLSSEIFPDVSKIGKTTDLEKRVYDLSRDNKYGCFDLKVRGWIRIKNYGRVEKMFHYFFNQYRLNKDIGLKVDTELFKTNYNLYDEWKKFIEVNYINNFTMKNEIFDYNF